MDDIVRQAIAKWPNVPNCFGWLGLDARGDWYLRDDPTQAAGPFAKAKGSVLRHEKLIDFIARNYESDAGGQWFFQNGPQRVYVELEATPWVWRIDAAPGFAVTSHTGKPAQVQHCIVGDDGRVYLATTAGFGVVHTLDMEHAADAIEDGTWTPEEQPAQTMPMRYGYVMSPQALQK